MCIEDQRSVRIAVRVWWILSTEPEMDLNKNRSYLVTITTELGETETLSVSARNEEKAEELVIDLVERRMVGLRGVFCRSVTVKEDSLGKGR